MPKEARVTRNGAPADARDRIIKQALDYDYEHEHEHEVAERFHYRTWLGLPSGGRPLRNSACCRSASRRCCASRDDCSGSGPGLPQPKKTRVSTGIKNIKMTSFFIAQPQHNQADACGNVSRSEKALSLKRAFQTP